MSNRVSNRRVKELEELSEAEFSVLFVCLGNICRSPVAEGIFKALLSSHGLSTRVYCDSCGTGSWHKGEQAHPKSRAVAKKFGVSIEEHRARQIDREDLESFNLIVVMDRSNYEDVKRLAKGETKNLTLMRSFDPDSLATELDVPDPFYGDSDGFDRVHQILERSCLSLIKDIEKRLGKN